MIHLAMLTLFLFPEDHVVQLDKYLPPPRLALSERFIPDQLNSEQFELELACRIARSRVNNFPNRTFIQPNTPGHPSVAEPFEPPSRTNARTIAAWQGSVLENTPSPFLVGAGVRLLEPRRQNMFSERLQIGFDGIDKPIQAKRFGQTFEFKEGNKILLTEVNGQFWIETWPNSAWRNDLNGGVRCRCSGYYHGDRSLSGRVKLTETYVNGLRILVEPSVIGRCFVFTSDNRLLKSNSMLEFEELQQLDQGVPSDFADSILTPVASVISFEFAGVTSD